MISFRPGSNADPKDACDSAAICGFTPGLAAPQTSAGWLMRQTQNPQEIRELAGALRRPVETILEEAIQREPERMARLFSPMLEEAGVQQRAAARARASSLAWRWLTGLTSPKVWGWTLQALWEGENLWRFVEDRALWFQVAEVAIFDPRNGNLLAKAEFPGRALLRHTPALESIPFLGVAGAQPAPSTASEGGRDGASTESQVIILVGQRCRMAVRVTGQPPLALRTSLQSLCHEADDLLERSGIAVASMRLLLEKIAERAIQGEGPATRAWTVRHCIAMLSMGLVLSADALTWIGVREYRWQSFLTLLHREPGVQVLSETTAWGHTQVEGIREPDARDPAQLAESVGVDLRHVTLHFPRITIARAELPKPLPSPSLSMSPTPSRRP